MQFDARIDGGMIRCTVTADRALPRPVFCASLMAPGHGVDVETLTTTGGYLEVQLPDLEPGEPCAFTLAYDEHEPVNRAWLPLGAYLRGWRDTIALPPLPAGVREGPARPVEPWDGLRLIPQPTRWMPAGGLLEATSFTGAGEALEAADALAARTGLGPFLDPSGVPLIHEVAPLGDGAYRLGIEPGCVRLTSDSRQGTFHGAVTLMTLVRTHAGRLPCGVIEDAPRFGWRGQHLDCARHFYTVGTILRLLDLMALMKLNRFHWHFADDEAFRLQIDSFPDLWRHTQIRGERCLIPGVFGGGVHAGGSYSKADVARVVAHAATLGIEVLPEIEVPAHALGLVRAVPGLRDPDDTGTERSVQGYAENVVNPALPRTWEVLEAIADEVAGLFPFRHLHLGGDELPEGTWDGSPAVDRLKAQEGLATRDDVQGWTMARLAGHLAASGIRSAAWEEAARGSQGGIGHGALLFSWTGQGPGVAAARAGYDVVMCSGAHAYFDMAHSGDPDDWGASWAGFIGLQDSVAWSPVPEPDIAERVIGVQGCFWSEFTTQDAQLEPMLAPRILGLAAKAWEVDEVTDGAALRALAGAYWPLWDALGWRDHRGA